MVSEKGTPKDIANRAKAKGLQRLRWYCQMCGKQCRDENGFKCHTTSESHLRQMRVFAENPDSVMEEFSQDFENDFIELLSRRFQTKRTLANQAYNEFIAHKSHVHMNSTKWETLTDFVKYLGKTGKCLVDETEKGWYIQWINRDPALLARQQAADKKRKVELDDEEKQTRAINAQVEAARELEESSGKAKAMAPSELSRNDDEAPVKLSMAPAPVRSFDAKRPRLAVPAFTEEDAEGGSSSGAKSSTTAKKSTMELLMEQEAKKKQAAAALAAQAQASSSSVGSSRDQGKPRRLANWLHPGIVVKVLNKKVADGRYYKQKGVVRRVIDDFIAEVKMLEGGDKLRVDQEQLETVVPAIGKEVLILNGKGRSCRGELLSLDLDNFSGSVRILSGPSSREVLPAVEYEDMSKVAD